MAATTLPRQDLSKKWRTTSRSASQPPTDLPAASQAQLAKKSPNRVKSKPANPAVISSILTSLETLEPPANIGGASGNGTMPPHMYFPPEDHSARPQSSASSFASAPNVPFSTVNGIRSRHFEVENDDDPDDDIATPPVIATSRSPSGLSHYSAVRQPSYGMSSVSLNPPSVGTRRSSNQSPSREKFSGSHNKLSAESWVKHNTASQESLEQPPKRRPHHLRRVSSHDTLRQTQPDKDFQPDQDFIFDSLGSLATDSKPDDVVRRTPRSSQKVLGKSRLYIGESVDDTSSRDVRAVTPEKKSRATFGSGEFETSPSERSRRSSQGPGTPNYKTLQSSPKPTHITDSIPLRTSSLRQSSSPASSKRKGKKQRLGTAASSSYKSSVSEANNTDATSLADLGEDDETVKRIMELRKRRETRMLDSDYHRSPPTPETAGPSSRTGSLVRDPSALTHTGDQGKQDPRLQALLRPAIPRSITDSPPPPRPPPAKAIKLLGINQGNQLNGNLTANGTTSGKGLTIRAIPGAEAKPGSLAVKRPATAVSTVSVDPPLSLDYSYAQAVDALQGAEREIHRRELSGDRVRTGMSAQNNNHLTPDPSKKPHRRTASQSSANNSSPLRFKKFGSYNRWAQGDVSEDPLDKRKSRRKSMSDARNPRPNEGDDEGDATRRDSIEEAVLDYLHAPRLSQRVPHPATGRLISFSEVGDRNGAAVLICVGMGLTRYVTAFFDELATTLRLRLITIERPGVGSSEPLPNTDKSGPLNWADDVQAVCEHLDISRFSILAHSAGAVYALATALILPHRVRGAIHLLGPWIPPSQLEAVSHSNTSAAPAGALPRGQRILRVLPTPFLKAANSSFMSAASASLKPVRRPSGGSPNGRASQGDGYSSESHSRWAKRPSTASGQHPSQQTENPRRESLMLMDRFMPDTVPLDGFPVSGRDEAGNSGAGRRSSLFLSATATPMDPNVTFASTALNAAEHAERERQLEFGSRLTHQTWEYAIRDSNPATDLLVCLERYREIGFRYTDVTRRVIITHGAEDKRVPVGNIKWLAEQMNRASLHRDLGSRDTYASEMGTGGGCEVRILDNQGHGLMASPIIMGDVLTEIAGYWTAEERGRIVQ